MFLPSKKILRHSHNEHPFFKPEQGELSSDRRYVLLSAKSPEDASPLAQNDSLSGLSS
jgi:hypothetical protein